MSNWYSFLAWQYNIIGEIVPNPTAALEAKWIAYGLGLAALGFVLSLVIGRPLLIWLKLKKIGKSIREDGPDTHLVKTGTPTMGGLMIITAILLVCALVIYITGRLSVLLPVGILISCGILGAVDDMLSLVGWDKIADPTEDKPETKRQRRRRERIQRRGLSVQFKLAWTLVISLVAAIILNGPLDLEKVYIPFIREPIVLGWFYIPIATIVIAGFSNAVNFTDGLDTLAGLTCAFAFIAYAIIGFLQGQAQVVLIGFAAAGACLGFLWYNAYPAHVFMGDTGALTLGALLAVLAFQTNQWLLLPVIGGVFVAEAASVILQVSYFKLTKRFTGTGQRLFKIAPLHHHFEKSGWSESQVTMRFALVGMILAMVGVALALL